MKNYIRYSWSECKDYIEDGLYSGFYNSENALIEVKDKVPVFVQLYQSSIYNTSSIKLSNVEVLISI